jgi:putative salt-induced outer membrane protein YdiY
MKTGKNIGSKLSNFFSKFQQNTSQYQTTAELVVLVTGFSRSCITGQAMELCTNVGIFSIRRAKQVVSSSLHKSSCMVRVKP